MSLSIRWYRWLRLLPWRSTVRQRPPRRAATDDYADCGTAFGLDLSMSAQALHPDLTGRQATGRATPPQR